MKNLTKMTLSSMFAYGVVFVSKASADASAGWGGNNQQPLNVPNDLEATIMDITNYILGFVAMIATLIVIYGGVLYLTSAGSEDAITKAKKTIIYGIVGIVVCGMAYAIVIVVSSTLLKGTASS